MLKFIFIIVALCIGTSSYALDTYKTQDVLLLYKSCYETIFFLGNTKYRGKRIPLKPEKVSAHCFCVCDKIRLNFKSGEFMAMDPGTINRTISPYSINIRNNHFYFINIIHQAFTDSNIFFTTINNSSSLSKGHCVDASDFAEDGLS